MNEFILNMYIGAVESSRIDIKVVPILYRNTVAEILNIGLE